MSTLASEDRNLLPVLNNGVTVVASTYSPKPGDTVPSPATKLSTAVKPAIAYTFHLMNCKRTSNLYLCHLGW